LALKPAIDAQFRTLADREHTVIAGSSLGASLATYAMLYASDTFGKAAVFSPAFWFNRDNLLATIRDRDEGEMGKIYFICGQYESSEMVSDMNNVRNALIYAGWPADDLAKHIDPDGQHNEASWDAQTMQAFRWLMNCKSDVQEESDELPVLLFPNPAGDEVYVALSNRDAMAQVAIREMGGRELRSQVCSSQPRLVFSLAGRPPATYNVVVTNTNGEQFFAPLIKK